ncbi:hypothetical protein C8R31_103231 [Nitrosospira sp. Nsp2]|nr:hypothetical protein C8R31_103231 [Nitrosospira sp. Nsp2]
MYRISFLSIPKAENAPYRFPRGEVTAYEHHRVTAYEHHSERHASYSSAKTVTAPLELATPADRFNHWRGSCILIQRFDPLRQCLMLIQNHNSKHHKIFTYPSQIFYIYHVTFG